MLILLPPSESKNPPPRRGNPVDLAKLSFPALTALRAQVLDALVETSGRDDAFARLDVGPSLAAEVERNTRLPELPARPALEVYNGVLYDALDAKTLSPAARRRAGSRLVIVSGLWGAVRPTDRIPAYRCNVCARLVGLGTLEPAWREVLPAVLAEAAGPKGVVVDCRSSSYLAMGRVPALGTRTVEVRVLRDEAGRRNVVSHMAKHTRGEVARHLLESGADPRTVEGLAEALADRWDVELHRPPRPGRPWTVDVVVQG
ncbi:YaaA family protein [Kineosporia sp. R_H_3]|uniref:YaaA family protein n=1 Tax=Kineosporia sp. R_H_3 TaxID=1961848 RepID=UPI000B4BCA55|nr:peroxide stress protein YaaA [Kineosporia sp. R_H_3]